MAIDAGNVVWNITADLKPLNQALGDSEKMVKSSMGNILAAGQKIGVAFTAIGAGITAGLGGAISSAISYGDSIDKASIKTGVATDELQKLKFGAEQSGVSFEQLQDAVIKMNRSISEASDSAQDLTEKGLKKQNAELEKLQAQYGKANDKYGEAESKLRRLEAAGKGNTDQAFKLRAEMEKNVAVMTEINAKASKTADAQINMADATGSQIEAFQKLGIKLETLKSLSPDQQFMKLADAISNVTDPATRTAIAMDLFGKSGAQLLPFLNEGSAGMAALGEKAKELGLIMGQEAIDNSVILGDQIDALKSQAMALAVQIGSALIPALIEIMPRIQQIVASIIQWIQNNPQLTTTILTVTAAIGAVMTVLGPLLIMLPGIVIAFAAIGPVVAAVGGILAAIAAGPVLIVIAALGALVAAGVYVYKHWEEFVEGAKILWEAFSTAMSAVWDGIKDAFEVGVYVVTTPLRQFVDGVQAGWEILQIAAGYLVDTFNAAWDAIVGGFEWVGDQLEGLWNWITGLMKSGVDGIISAINYLTSLLGLGELFSAPAVGDVPGRALGGPVEGGMPYIVGEQGQELFVPQQDGRVVPAGQTAQMMRGGPVTININGYNRDPRSLSQEISRIMRDDQVLFGMA